jgi:hypothetical protein
MDNDLLLPHAAVATSNCKLPEYWPDAPALWFSRAECSFLLRNVTEQREKFCLVVQHAPGRRPGRGATSGTDVQRPEGAASTLSPAGRLIHSKSLRQIPAAEGAVGDGGLYAAMCAAPPAYRDLFAEFQRVLNSSGKLPSPTHGVLHQLETTGPPVTANLAAGYCQVKGGERGVPVHGKTGNYTAVQEQLGVPFAYGAQGGWLMAAVRRLPPFEPGYNSGQVPYPQRPGLHRPPSWVPGVLQAGPQEGVLPGEGRRRRRLQNGGHHSLRAFGVPQDAVWTFFAITAS